LLLLESYQSPDLFDISKFDTITLTLSFDIVFEVAHS
jgi:hypothetical protein